MMNKESLAQLLQTLLPVLIGCICLWLYLKIQKKKTKLKKIGEVVDGVVFEISHDSSGTNTSNSPYPVIRFVTKNGVWITEQNNFSSSSFVKRGKKVEVLYNPENPKDFIADLGNPTNLIMPLCLVIGLALIVFGIYNLYASKILELFNT